MPITPTLEPKVVGTVVTTLGRGWLVTDLFANGEKGTFSDIHTYATNYFSDAGTTPAEIGDPIYQINDQSGNGANWTQATATARPILAREPITGRRNLLTHTEDFSNPVWGDAIGVRSGPSTRENVSHPDLGTICKVTTQSLTGGVRQVIGSSTGLLENGKRYGTRVWIKAGTCSTVLVEFENGEAVFGDGGLSFVDLQTGKITGSNAYRSEAVPLYDGWLFTCWLDSKPEGSLLANFQITATGQAEEGLTFYFGQPQFQEGEGLFPYQKVASQYDVTEEGVPSIQYLRFDLGDDVLNATLAAGTYTVVLPTREGIFFDEVVHAGGTFSIGPTSYTGGPAGILEALATSGECRMIGPPMAIDRALSAGERNRPVRWYQARGAGPEYTP